LQFLVAGMRPFSPAIEHVSVPSLKPYPRNARRHSKAQIKQIAASIERFGFNNPVLIADDGGIIAGHGRVAAAKLLGIETVPAVRLSHLTEVERRAYVIADNKLALNAGWDREMLAIELQGLVDLDFEVELTGFSLAEVDIVLDEARESAPDGADALDRGHDPSLSARGARCYAAGRPLDARAAQTHLR
jgi:ParB-like chromosome segregation protein Spo0J